MVREIMIDMFCDTEVEDESMTLRKLRCWGLEGERRAYLYAPPLHQAAYPADAILNVAGEIRDDRENRREAVLSVQNMRERLDNTEFVCKTIRCGPMTGIKPV